MEDPPWHKGFRAANNTAEVHQASAFSAEITLTLENQDLTADYSSDPVLCQTKIWQLNFDQQAQYIFTNPMQALRRKIVVDESFTNGHLFGDFKDTKQVGNYPLPQDLEIVFYANWLGNYGDLILHASGFAWDGKGYASTGPSGVGKSTLAGLLKDEPGHRFGGRSIGLEIAGRHLLDFWHTLARKQIFVLPNRSAIGKAVFP